MSRAIKRLFRRIDRGLVRRQVVMDVRSLSDEELRERLRELFPTVVKAWRIDATQEAARLVIFGLKTCPSLGQFLSHQEALDLGL